LTFAYFDEKLFGGKKISINLQGEETQKNQKSNFSFFLTSENLSLATIKT
jgi:hypothetical protein